MTKRIAIEASNYHMPPFGQHAGERCRDCAEKIRTSNPIGNNIDCKIHMVVVRHSYRCDQWHKPGTLFA